MAFCEKDKVTWEAAPAAQFHRGSSSDQKHRGACRGKRFILREHVPDGFGELASDVDPGDLRAALTAQAPLGPLVALAIVSVAGSVGGGLDERPAEVLRAVLGAREAADVADLRGDRVGEDRTDPEGPSGGAGWRGGRRRASGGPPRWRRSPPPARRPSAGSSPACPSRARAGRAE